MGHRIANRLFSRCHLQARVFILFFSARCRTLVPDYFSQGLVKLHGPDDLRTELKDVSVFRMDVHAPSAPSGAESQVRMASGRGLNCALSVSSPLPLTSQNLEACPIGIGSVLMFCEGIARGWLTRLGLRR